MKKSIVRKFGRQFRTSFEIGLLLFLLVVCILKRNLMPEVFTPDVLGSGAGIMSLILMFNAGRLVEFIWPTIKRKKVSEPKNNVVQFKEPVPTENESAPYTPPANPKRFFQNIPLGDDEEDEDDEEDIESQDAQDDTVMPEET